MTKKHFEAIAKIIHSYTQTYRDNDSHIRLLVHIAEDMADTFKEDNPRFQQNKFLVACGTHHRNR